MACQRCRDINFWNGPWDSWKTCYECSRGSEDCHHCKDLNQYQGVNDYQQFCDKHDGRGSGN